MKSETEFEASHRVRGSIAEDDHLLARSLECFSVRCGCAIVGMAPTVDTAREFVTRRAFNVAVLSAHLRSVGATARTARPRLR